MNSHITDKPFVLATGLAALIHSTWSLGTLFSGEQPPVENIESVIQFIHFIGWLLPALLMAIALDVGQIVTSHEIRTSGLTWQRGLTFFVFGFATYYLQWLYIALHMPALELANGVSVAYSSFAIIMRDSAMWLIPALLPLSTILYTFSGNQDDKQKSEENMHSDNDIQVVSVGSARNTVLEFPVPESANNDAQDDDLLHFEDTSDLINLLWCPDCGYDTGKKDTMSAAQRALRVHQSQHCKANIEVLNERI